MNNSNKYDVIVIGGGAAGLMAAASAGKRGRRVVLIEHTAKIGEKIRISGGGRCNFTNLNASPQNYISQNPHFCKSALASYTQHDFIAMVQDYDIAYHEKTLGQLFCDGSSKQIIDMMLDQCKKANVEIRTQCSVQSVEKADQFALTTTDGILCASSLVLACGGLSIPKIGASDFGYRVAKQFGHRLVETRPALVPLIVEESSRDMFTNLSGVSNASVVSYGKTSFRESILFTHKGVSGPAILQISSYMPKFMDEAITINLLPDIDLGQQFTADKNSKQSVSNYLRTYLPNRFVDKLAEREAYSRSLTETKKDDLLKIADGIHNFKVSIGGSEGYRKAEVTVGGVDTNDVSSKTMESKKVPGLYFVGEVVDVTGWLGGYNFQWAWSSGFAAGQYC